MTRFFLDTEFDEDGKTIELVSIGLVCEDGRSYYAVSREFDPLHCNPWVQTHVLSKLPPAGAPEWKPRAQIRDELLTFVNEGETQPEFWGYYADYDWVAFCQLWGRMIDLPKHFPMYCRDLKQLMAAAMVLKRDLPEQDPGTMHTAIGDAFWNKASFEYIQDNCLRR